MILVSAEARSIGVSNYCPSCFECLAKTDVFPFTNQVMFHVGMGPKSGFDDIVKYSKDYGSPHGKIVGDRTVVVLLKMHTLRGAQWGTNVRVMIC